MLEVSQKILPQKDCRFKNKRVGKDHIINLMFTNQTIRAQGKYADGLVEGARGQVFAVAAPSYAVHFRRVTLLLPDLVMRLKKLDQLLHSRSGSRHRCLHSLRP